MSSILLPQNSFFYAINIVAALFFAVLSFILYWQFRKLSIKKIELSDADFQSVFEKAPAGIAIYTVQTGKIIAVNDFFAHLIGYPKAMFVRTRIQEMTGWDDALFREHVDNVLQGEIAFIPEISFRQRQSGSIDVEVTSSPMTYKGDQCIMSFVRDISEDISGRMRIEARLRQLGIAVEQSQSSVVITNLDGKIEYLNPKFTELTGFRLHEVLDMRTQINIAVDKDPAAHKEMWETVVAGRTWRGELLNKKKNNEPYVEYASVLGIKDPFGNITHYLKVAEDISDRKKMEKFKDDFVNIVSHELRTPLTSIKESINVVCDGSTGPVSEGQKEFLETARRNVERLGRLINEVLDFQKLRAGVMKFEMKEADINNILEEVRQMVQALADKKGLELKMDLAAGLPMIFLDRDKIIQVAVNLVHNAVKFTAQGSVSLISAMYKENCIMVSVVDTGIGIEKEEQAKLFKSFNPVLSPEYRASAYMGLGLIISKEIIRQHGGKLSVESEPGKGSTFSFILPVLDRRIHLRE
jgi:PAS domain S-box-containing protein